MNKSLIQSTSLILCLALAAIILVCCISGQDIKDPLYYSQNKRGVYVDTLPCSFDTAVSTRVKTPYTAFFKDSTCRYIEEHGILRDGDTLYIYRINYIPRFQDTLYIEKSIRKEWYER